MTNLTDLLPAGAGGKQVSFTADGAISQGDTVVLQTDGTVSSVVLTSQATGTPVVFESASTTHTATTFDSINNKVVIAYTDAGNSNYGTAIVGTVSGTSISFGTPVVYYSGSTSETAATFDSNAGKVVVAYRDGTLGAGDAVVGTVSGTSISFGTPATFQSGGPFDISATFDSSNNKVVIAYRRASDGHGVAIVGTVSGTSISFGTGVVFEAAAIGFTKAIFDPNSNKIVIPYTDDGNSSYGTAIVGTVSGTSISFGSPVVFESSGQEVFSSTFDSISNQVVILYKLNSGSNPYAIVGAVSGTSITFGSAALVESALSLSGTATFDPDANKVVAAYRSFSPGGSLRVGTISGTSISFGSTVAFEAAATSFMSSTFDSSNSRVVIAYQDEGNLDYGTAAVFRNESTNSADFIGIADEAISDTESGNITIRGGVATNSSLSIPLTTGTETNLTGYTQGVYPAITYDITNTKFVVFFQDSVNSLYGTSVVVTVSGTTVTFGTPVVFNSGSTYYIDAAYTESNGKHLAVYSDYSNSQQATAIVGTVSGTSISFGSEQVYDTGTANTRLSVAYNSNLDKYLAGSTPSLGTINVTVLTVSGSTVSAGTPVSLSGTKYKPNIASNESASDFVLGNNKNDNQSEAHLISVSGTVPTVETSVDLSAVVSSSFPSTGLAFLESNKFVCVYSDFSTNSMYTRTITVSGTSLSLGTASSAFTVDSNSQTDINGAWPLFKVTTTSAYLYYQDDTSNYLKYVPISISGTTANSGDEVTYTSETSNYEGFLYSADAKQSLSFFQSTNSGSQTAAIAQNASLTPGSTYYVQRDGTLATSPANPSVEAGKALSATSINLDYSS